MKFLIEQTRVTPLVEYLDDESTLHLSGRSSPENPIIFYQRVTDFLDEFALSSESDLVVNVTMEYFNTSSTKCVFNVFRKMNEIREEYGKVVSVNWYYEEWDDDMMEMGEDFDSCLDIEFNLEEVEDINSLSLEAA